MLAKIDRKKLPTHLITRYAPSVTGRLHLGHVASALSVWGIAETLGAKVLIRLEDHDKERSRKEYEESILEDLYFLGFLKHPLTKEVIHQRDQEESFQKAFETLNKKELLYPCYCSRKEILSRCHQKTQEIFYDGLCYQNKSQSGGHSFRVHVTEPEQSFLELEKGLQVQNISNQCGDFVVKDRKGFWSYQLACVVSDNLSGVNLIIRGEDLLSSTGRQVYLQKSLGYSTEVSYFHHPLIYEKDSKKKLSKSEGSEGIGVLRAQGWSAEEIRREAASLVGL